MNKAIYLSFMRTLINPDAPLEDREEAARLLVNGSNAVTSQAAIMTLALMAGGLIESQASRGRYSVNELLRMHMDNLDRNSLEEEVPND